jgi:hypothetical protein
MHGDLQLLHLFQIADVSVSQPYRSFDTYAPLALAATPMVSLPQKLLFHVPVGFCSSGAHRSKALNEKSSKNACRKFLLHLGPSLW